MAKRLYIVQFLDARAGWTNMPQTATPSLKEAKDQGVSIACLYFVATRTHQMPKGWTPDNKVVTPLYTVGNERFSLSQQIKEAREEKR